MGCCEVFISGHVQGVGYRWFARQQAQRYGVRGHVRNLPDGRVEVVACADDAPLAEFLAVLRRGPGYGRVTEFIVNDRQTPPNHEGFRVAY